MGQLLGCVIQSAFFELALEKLQNDKREFGAQDFLHDIGRNGKRYRRTGRSGCLVSILSNAFRSNFSSSIALI